MRNNKIIIAGTDSVCCSEIYSILQSFDPNSTVLEPIRDGKQLLDAVTSQEPDVVICEASLPGPSCFEVMQRVGIRQQNATRFIVYGNRDFDSVYKSLKFGAVDYLVQPISPDSLYSAMEKLSSLSTVTNADSASRLFYVDDKGMSSLNNKKLSIRQINQMYGTNFTSGFLRMVFVKYDAIYSFDRLNQDNDVMLDKTDEQIRRNFGELCSDIIITRKLDGAMAVLNYSASKSALIDQRIQDLYKKLHRIVLTTKDIDITLCCSAEITDPCNVWQIKEQVRDCEWLRMILGTNKIIYWKNNSIATDPEALGRLDQILGRVQASVDTLHIEHFREAAQDFYSLSEDILISREARQAFKQMVYCAFEKYWDTISEFTDPTKAYDEISYYSHLCTTFTRHRDVFLSEYAALMQKIADQTEKKYSISVADAIHYISRNLNKPISLKEVANYVHLSQAYFSNLFKQETGQNFTKYVSRQKNNYACELLSRTDLTISEIAFRTGFPDVRAFSKQFRAINETTPSHYRQLHVDSGTRER